MAQGKNARHEIPFVFTKIGRWWDKDVEVDIVAADEEKSHILAAECKFHNNAVNDSDLEKHLNKSLSGLRAKANAQTYIWYFSWGGFTEEAREYASNNQIHIVEGNDLFR